MKNETLKKFNVVGAMALEGGSRYGVPEPRLEIQFQKGTCYRRVKAALLALASEAELATPVTEQWVIQVEDLGGDVGRLFLELVEADTAEVGRAMAFLRELAASRGGPSEWRVLSGPQGESR